MRPVDSARPVGPSGALLSAESRVLCLVRLVWGCKGIPIDQGISASYSIPARGGLKRRRVPVLRRFIGSIGRWRQLSRISPSHLNSKGGIRNFMLIIRVFFQKVSIKGANCQSIVKCNTNLLWYFSSYDS